MMQQHDEKVNRLRHEVTRFYQRKKPFYIFHGSTNATRSLDFTRDNSIDVSQFNQVLDIDKEAMTMLVEPNVPMDILLAEALKHDLLPPVVMEFPGITVGGGIQGFAGESSSFKWGTFNATCTWAEMVLADGRVVTCSANERSDLFYGAAGSFGSLGIMTAARISLIPAKKYVVLTYEPITSFDDAVEKIEVARSANSYDYIDGIMFSSSNGVLMLGKLSDTPVNRVVRFSRAHDNWFYLHAEKISMRAQHYTESIPITDYLFRYDRGAFWVGRFPYERAHWPYNRITRWLVDPLMHTRKLYQALHASGASHQYLIQDLALPVPKAANFMRYIDKQFHTYPIWLCPLKLERDWIMLRDGAPETVINIGVWDNHPFRDHNEFIKANRELEATLRKLGGQKWFYAHAYYTEKEFWSIYNRKKYDALRRKYAAETLPDVFHKIQNKDRKPIQIKKASLQTLFGMSKLKIRN